LTDVEEEEEEGEEGYKSARHRLPFTWGHTQKGGKELIDAENYRYRRDHVRGHLEYYRCKLRTCPARAVVTDDKTVKFYGN
jgi:hypothetical protein